MEDSSGFAMMDTSTHSLPSAVAAGNNNNRSDEVVVVASTTNSSSARKKRPRSTTPIPTTPAASISNNNNENDILRAAKLRNPIQLHSVLNELLKATANHEVNYSLQSDTILNALADVVLKDCLGYYNNNLEEGAGEPPELMEKDAFIVFRSRASWIRPPTTRMQAFADFCCHRRHNSDASHPRNPPTDDDEIFPVLEAIAMILRNLSFTSANWRLLAYSPSILHVLIAFLYIGSNDERYRRHCGKNDALPLTMSSLHTLLNLVKYLDVTGQQLLVDKLFYDASNPHTIRSTGGPVVPGPHDFGQLLRWGGLGACQLSKRLDVREDSMDGVSTRFLLEHTSDYLEAVWSIFPALTHAVTDEQVPRPVVLLMLDLLQEWIGTARVGLVGSVQQEEEDVIPDDEDYEIPNLRAILVNVPDSILKRLTDLLYIPRLGSDSLEYVDPVSNIVPRVTTLKLLVSYDATVDTDVRDRALDVLVPLLELDSPRMAVRLGRESSCKLRTRLYDALVPILTTSVGRNEASMLASQLFRELAQAPENKVGLEYVQNRLVELASRDARVSRLVWNDLYGISADENEDDDEEEEGETAATK